MNTNQRRKEINKSRDIYHRQEPTLLDFITISGGIYFCPYDRKQLLQLLGRQPKKRQRHVNK